MSTRQRPLPASCVYFDRQRYSLGLPRIAVAGSAAQLFALGVDVAADQARHSVPDGTDIDGPVPVGHEPASLLRSAELLLRRPAPIAASPAIDELSDRAALTRFACHTSQSPHYDDAQTALIDTTVDYGCPSHGGHFALGGSNLIRSSGDQVDRSGVPLKRARAAYGMAG